MKKRLKSLKDIFKKCKHPDTSLIVIDGFAEWEITALKCSLCKNILHKTISNN